MAATARRQQNTLSSARLREALVGYAFIAVPMGIFLVFFIYPLLYSLYISRYDWGVFGKIETVGWANYQRAVARRDLLAVDQDHAQVHGRRRPARDGAALSLAVIVNAGIRGRSFFRSAFYFPSLASSAAITAIAIYILSADGLLNAIIGGDRSWFGDSDTALWSIAGLNTWTTSGTMMLFYLAALQAIPTDVYEAAAMDGAKTWRTFWKITFPLLKPGHFFVSVVSVIGALQVFDQAFIVSGGSGGPNYSTLTAVLYLYRTAINDVRFGYAATIGIALFVLIFTLTLIQRLLFGKAETA